MPNTVVKMPQLGESVAEGTIGRWLKKLGDHVERDEPLVEIQTDKVNAEVPSPVAGILQQILLPEGTTAAVKSDMAVIGDEVVSGTEAPPSPLSSGSPADPLAPSDSWSAVDGSSPADLRAADDAPPPSQLPAAQRPEGTTPLRPPAPSPARKPTPQTFSYDKSAGGGVVGQRDDDVPLPAGNGVKRGEEGSPPAAANGAKRFYTPVVLRMAEEHDIDLNNVQGSGAHGRVTRKDVERAIDQAATASAGPADASAGPAAASGPSALAAVTAGSAAPAAGSAAPAGSAPQPMAPLPLTDGAATDEVRPLSPMRRAIAEHMTRARAEIPDAWSLTEIDVTNLVRQRQKLQADWQAREGYELTYLPFFVKAVLAGLRAVPELNASFNGDHITLHREYNLGIAVSLENGLVVPVLRGADQLSVAGIAGALRNIITRARSGKLTLDDLQGATFTVNNPGSLGSIMSQPIVPVGQAGIVTMEAIVKRPVVTADDAIAIRSMMNSCLSFDHRVLDGSGALKFLRTLKVQLETVELPLY